MYSRRNSIGTTGSGRRSRREFWKRPDDLAAAQRESPFVLIGGDGWHPGVVGIIAGRLKDRHAKPALVAGFAEEADEDVPGVVRRARLRMSILAR